MVRMGSKSEGSWKRNAEETADIDAPSSTNRQRVQEKSAEERLRQAASAKAQPTQEGSHPEGWYAPSQTGLIMFYGNGLRDGRTHIEKMHGMLHAQRVDQPVPPSYPKGNVSRQTLEERLREKSLPPTSSKSRKK